MVLLYVPTKSSKKKIKHRPGHRMKIKIKVTHNSPHFLIHQFHHNTSLQVDTLPDSPNF